MRVRPFGLTRICRRLHVDTFLRWLWRAVWLGGCAGLSFVAIAQTCTPHQATQYQFSTSGSVRNGTQRPSIQSAWNESASVACNDISGQYNTEFSFTNSVPPAYVVTSYSSTGSWDGTNCIIGGTKTTTSCNSNSNPVCGAPSTTALSGNFAKATRVVQVDCTTCAGKSGVQDTANYTLGWSRVPGGSFPKSPTDAQLKSIVVGPAYWPTGSTCNKGCTATVGGYAQGFVSTTPSATGLYRMSADFVVTGAGASCAVGASDGNNSTAPPAACDGFTGSIGGKTACVAPVGSSGGSANVPSGAVVGNPTADSSGSGAIGTRTPSNGSGGNGGGPPTTLDGQPIGSDSNGDGVADIGGSSGSGGTGTTDPCTANNFATGCYGTAPGQPSGLYTAKSRTFTQVFQQFQTTLSSSGIGSGVANFFSVNFSAGQCPTWSAHIPYIEADMNIDFMCSTPFQSLLLAMRGVLLIVAGWAAFRIALY
jgi:hypothetical protein